MTDVVDAHFHIWRQADLPWLLGAIQPRLFGPYEAITFSTEPHAGVYRLSQ